jgi:hypothetical protein
MPPRPGAAIGERSVTMKLLVMLAAAVVSTMLVLPTVAQAATLSGVLF